MEKDRRLKKFSEILLILYPIYSFYKDTDKNED